MIAVRMPPPPTARWSITGSILSAGRLGTGVLAIDDGRVASAIPAGARSITLPHGWIVAPGFWDLQVNGFAGAEIGDDPDQLAHVAAALPAHGVTGFCPTLVTRGSAAYRRAEAAFASVRWPRRGARSLGVHLEGPFLSPRRPGAHPSSALATPTPDAVRRLAGRFGPRIVTLAPELDGALDAVAALSGAGIVAAIGHTDADAATCGAAIAAGARMLTHAFNAMPGMTAREPGPVGAFLDAPDAYIGVIGDGVHVAPATLRVLAAAAGPRLVAVSDAVAAAAAGPGSWRLAGRRITSDGTSVRDTSGRLAGSAIGLESAPARIRAVGQSTAAGLGAVSLAPRRLLGERRPLAHGAPADLVILDADLRPRATVIGGELVWQNADPELDLS
jgi:N-acetylglucosamine-6-phosphate deacetylase